MKRLVMVGTGIRGYLMFAKHLYENYKDSVRIVGVYDPNYVRCEYYKETTFSDMNIYSDFDEMLDCEHPDGVIVTTVDRYHHEYIIRSLEKGYEVFSEKPMTVDEEKCIAIINAERKSGNKVNVTFNCRFMPYYAKVKELVASGVIGKPLAVHYNYVLDKNHGGSYFKRWHRFLENSGGMMVHKATHHFDIVNWVLDDEPVYVSAHGARLFYGDESKPHSKRCSECEFVNECPSRPTSAPSKTDIGMYLNAEHVDGYIKDHCAYLSDTDIYDTMSVSVTYKKGAILTYSLTLYDNREGYTINVIGDKGSLEASTFFEGDEHKIIIHKEGNTSEEVLIPKGTGIHMGGDERLLEMFFGDGGEDTLGQCADSFDGAKSAMIGIAANHSIKTGERVFLTPILDKMR